MIEKHLEKLIGFYEIARLKSFLRAAQSLGISQPALTKSMQILEQNAGVPLMIRHRRGIELTDSGKELYNYCEKLFSELPNLTQRMLKPLQLSGVINIGTYETLSISFWPKALKLLRSKLPDIEIRLSTENPQIFWQRLDQGIINCIVDAEPPLSEKYFSKVLYTDRFCLYASPHFKLKTSQNEPIPMSYVKKARSRDGDSIEESLNKYNLNYKLVFNFDTFASVKATVTEGLAVGVLPLTLAKHDIKLGHLIEFHHNKKAINFGEHRICITCLESHRKDPRIRELFQNLTKIEF